MQFVSDHIVSGNGGKKTEGKKAKHIRQSEGHGMNLHNFFDGLGFSYFRVEKDKIEVKVLNLKSDYRKGKTESQILEIVLGMTAGSG